MSISKHLPPLVFLAVCSFASVAQACPVCFSGMDENREAFFATFVFLTVTPLLGAGLLIWWLVQRARDLELEEREAARAAPPATTPDA